MKGVVSGACVGLALAVTSSCGQEADPSLGPPEIRLTKPVPESKVSRGESIEFAGEVVTGPGAWVPGVVIVRILGDREGRKEEGSVGAEFDPNGGVSGVVPFSGKMEVRMRAGRYFAQAMGVRDLAGRPGVAEVLTKPIPLVVSQ
jgi:hypothetical protein